MITSRITHTRNFINHDCFYSSSSGSRYSYNLENIINQVGTKKVTHYRPGLIVIQNALSPEEQIHLANETIQAGDRPLKGFWKVGAENGAEKTARELNQKIRGRMYDNINIIPSLSSLTNRCIEEGNQIDPTLEKAYSTHVISLCYPLKSSIPWHYDNGENDGEGTKPIISLSMGLTAAFTIRPYADKPLRGYDNQRDEVVIWLRSGDCAFLYGDCRFAWHSVTHIQPGTCPEFLPKFLHNHRLNLTCRHTPSLYGQEDRFATLPPEQIKKLKDNPFYNVTKMNYGKE